VRPAVMPAASAASLPLLLPTAPMLDFFLSMLCRTASHHKDNLELQYYPLRHLV
jgi:hypothetical protein